MADTKKVQMTQAAFEKLKAELAHLEGSAREKVIDSIASARAHGDLSENAEYHAAREQQGMQEARVRTIRNMLENAEIVEAQDDGIAGHGKLVTIRHVGDGEAETYRIGLREEKGGEHDILTPDSPVGRAVVGHSAGETVVARVPSGSLKIEIVEVRAPK